MTRTGIAFVLLAVCRGAEADESMAMAMDPAAKGLLDRAAAQFSAKHYELSSRDFAAGFRIEPALPFLFGWAQSERLRGNCAVAVDLYRKVFSLAPTPQQAEIARHHIHNCESVLSPPWYRNVLADALTGTGVVLVGGGAGMLGVSVRAEAQAREAATYIAYHDARRAGQPERIAGIVGLSLGVAFVVGGTVGYLLGRRTSLAGTRIASPGAGP